MKIKLFPYFILSLAILLAACSSDPAKGFVEYRSADDFDQASGGDYPDFSFKHPPGWQTGWFGEGDLIALLVTPGGLEETWSDPSFSEGYFLIVPGAYSGEDPLELFHFAQGSPTEKPTTINLNGHIGARTAYVAENQQYIEVILTQGNDLLDILAVMPKEREDELRPTLEAIMGTIKMGEK